MLRVERNGRWGLTLAALLAPLVGWGAWRALDVQAHSPTSWVSPDHPERRDYEEFSRHFDAGDVILAGWPGCTLDDPRLTTFLAAARESSNLRDADGRPYLKAAVSGVEMLQTLLDVRVDRPEALQRLQGTFIGPDESTCAMLHLTDHGAHERGRVVPLIQQLLADSGIPSEEQRLAGPVMDGLAVDQASAESLNRYAGISAAFIFVLSCWCLKSIRASLVVFAAALYCEGATLALLYFTGGELNALLIVMPPLILVLGVSSGVHLVHYFHEAQAHGPMQEAPARAVQMGWLPCALSAGTTAVGLGSLCISDLEPIRSFGLYTAIGVATSFFSLFLIAPAAFLWWTRKTNATKPTTEAFDGTESAWWAPLANLAERRHAGVAIFVGLLMTALAFGLPRLQTSVHLRTMFPLDSPILRDYAWMERHVGPLVPIEVVLKLPRESSLSPVQRLELVRKVEQALAQVDDVGGTMSAATFAPSLNRPRGFTLGMYRALLNRRLRESSLLAGESGYMAKTDDAELWRVTARLSALDDLDYGDYLRIAREAVEPVIQAESQRTGVPIQAAYTGIMPLVHELQRELFEDLFASFLFAFVAIAAVMAASQRGVAAGLISMASNVFPMVVTFGLLGWLNAKVDIGSVMTASVALGIAVDDTLHFLTFFRRGLNLGQSRVEAVRFAYRHCATAMLQTTVVLGFGMLVFAFSDFLPTARFAWMIFSLLFLALIGDLLFLPALLIGPLGRFFRPLQSGAASASLD